jgi:hypothetical protein
VAPAFTIVREWCGPTAVERRDELQALRAEVRRLGALVERAVTALRAAGETTTASQIERDVGIPVQLLRQSESQ